MFGGRIAQNRTNLRGRFKQFGRFILNHLNILRFSNIGIADVHQLHDLAFGNNIGCIRHDFQNAHTAGINHQLESARIQKVADQHRRRVAEQIIRRFASAAQIAFIDHIVMQQGRSVDKFHHCCQSIQLISIIADRLTCQNRHNRTQTLTAGTDNISTDLRNQRNIRLNRLVDHLIDPWKVFRQMALEIRQVFEHNTFSVSKMKQACRINKWVGYKAEIILPHKKYRQSNARL